MVLRELWGDKFEHRINSLRLTVKGALEFIESNFHKECDRVKIAAHINVSLDYLSKIFRQECGLKLIEYVTLCRIHHSRELLAKRPRMKVKDIAAAVGVPDVDYFCKSFKKHTALTPKEFREKSIAFD